MGRRKGIGALFVDAALWGRPCVGRRAGASLVRRALRGRVYIVVFLLACFLKAGGGVGVWVGGGWVGEGGGEGGRGQRRRLRRVDWGWEQTVSVDPIAISWGLSLRYEGPGGGMFL